MRNKHNSSQIQCPSCGTKNDFNASTCCNCGRILKLRAKIPRDYRPLIPLVFIGGVVVIIIFVYGFLEYTRNDAIKNIANGEYESAAKELKQISFYKDSDELLDSPELENCDIVVYDRARKLYEEGDIISALSKLQKIETYKDSEDLLKKYACEFLESWWVDSDNGTIEAYFSADTDETLEVTIGDVETFDSESGTIIFYDMKFDTDESGLVIKLLYNDDAGNPCNYIISNISEDSITINGWQFEKY